MGEVFLTRLLQGTRHKQQLIYPLGHVSLLVKLHRRPCVSNAPMAWGPLTGQGRPVHFLVYKKLLPTVLVCFYEPTFKGLTHRSKSRPPFLLLSTALDVSIVLLS